MEGLQREAEVMNPMDAVIIQVVVVGPEAAGEVQMAGAEVRIVLAGEVTHQAVVLRQEVHQADLPHAVLAEAAMAALTEAAMAVLTEAATAVLTGAAVAVLTEAAVAVLTEAAMVGEKVHRQEAVVLPLMEEKDVKEVLQDEINQRKIELRLYFSYPLMA